MTRPPLFYRSWPSPDEKIVVYAWVVDHGTGSDPPAAIYLYSSDSRAERSVTHMDRYKGIL
jgi:hypothetical protein